jgi:hypothetical protein
LQDIANVPSLGAAYYSKTNRNVWDHLIFIVLGCAFVSAVLGLALGLVLSFGKVLPWCKDAESLRPWVSFFSKQVQVFSGAAQQLEKVGKSTGLDSDGMFLTRVASTFLSALVLFVPCVLGCYFIFYLWDALTIRSQVAFDYAQLSPADRQDTFERLFSDHMMLGMTEIILESILIAAFLALAAGFIGSFAKLFPWCKNQETLMAWTSIIPAFKSR